MAVNCIKRNILRNFYLVFVKCDYLRSSLCIFCKFFFFIVYFVDKHLLKIFLIKKKIFFETMSPVVQTDLELWSPWLYPPDGRIINVHHPPGLAFLNKFNWFGKITMKIKIYWIFVCKCIFHIHIKYYCFELWAEAYLGI